MRCSPSSGCGALIGESASGRARKAFLVSDVTQLEEKWKSLEDDGEKEKFVRSHEENIQVLEDVGEYYCSQTFLTLLNLSSCTACSPMQQMVLL